MKRLMLCAALALPLTTMPASAEFLYSFNDLNRSCQSKSEVETRGCMMFIMGVWLGALHGDVLGRVTPQQLKRGEQPSDATIFCVPEGTQFPDLAMRTIKTADALVQKSPEWGHQPAVTVVTASLMKLYPCANSAWSKQ